MVNRVIAAKDLKRKRRGRYAIFSGATAKYAERVGVTPFTEDEQGKTTTLSAKRILVGPVSLSNQTINTGRGPSQERMSEYYARLHSFTEVVPPTMGCTEPIREYMERYNEILNETKNMRITLEINSLKRLDLFFRSDGNEWFFVSVDYVACHIRRSRVYGSKKFALDRLKMKRVTWVERIPKKTP